MSKPGDTFFTTVGCMDGRVQTPVTEFGKVKFGALFADTITEAGLVGLLAKENVSQNLLESIKNKINISLEKHHSRGIIVHGHQECAGNPVDDEKHKDDVISAAALIRSFVPQEVKILPVFVKRDNNQWVIEELPQTFIA